VLPHGYTVSIMLALVPPMWFAATNPLVEAASKNIKVDEATLRKSNIVTLSSVIGLWFWLTVVTFYMIPNL